MCWTRKNRTCSFEQLNLSLDKSWSPGAYIYIAKTTINIHAQNVHQKRNWEFILGTKICKSIRKGEKGDLTRNLTVFQQDHCPAAPMTKNWVLRLKHCRDKLSCNLFTLPLFFKLSKFTFIECKIILMKENYIWIWIYCKSVTSTVTEIAFCFSYRQVSSALPSVLIQWGCPL